MINPDQIPDEVVEAALEAFTHASGLGLFPDEDEEWREDLVNGMRASIAAALNAWPGAQESGMTYGKISTRIYILPLSIEEQP